MKFDKIRLEFTHAERVARIRLSSPKANILDRTMIRELDAAFAECARRTLNAIVVTADGPHFSFGASVQDHLPDQIAGTLCALHALLRRMHDARSPLIAAVRGQCLGGGLELAIACDVIIADKSAQFASPEIKLGVFAPAASALLPARIGQAAASRVLLSGAAMSAEEAAGCGLVAKIVDDLDAGLNGWLESDFIPRSASSLKFACRAARLRLRRVFEEDLPKLEKLYLSELMATPDALEGIRAFIDKRPPQWHNSAGRAHEIREVPMTTSHVFRCSRCGRPAGKQDKFCAECGLFLRDAAIDQRLLLALVDERDGRSQDARHGLERLLSVEPDHVLANHLLGTLHFHEGLLDRAAQYYEKAVAAAPSFVLGYYDLGVAYYHRGDMPRAAEAFRRCLEIDPNYNAAHYRLALAYFHSGQLDDAREHFQLSLALTPEYMMAHYHLGIVHERQGEYEAAAREFERSLEESSGDVSSLYHLALVRDAQGEHATAEQLRRRARGFARSQPVGTK